MTSTRPSTTHRTTLADLPKGARATILGMPESASQMITQHMHRLAELGFLPGEVVRVVALGIPTGDPIAVRLGRATFALRRFEAALIEVEMPPRHGRTS
ncbi:MAG: ferrous iron transport protein A [Gammaproteobacteria bacterium]|nr:ferrous iron transport protein A [Gammaproteobacteria bacterium]